MEDKDIEMYVADAIMERPYTFYMDEEMFQLYPVTLGKFYLIGRIVESLEIDHKLIQKNPYLEALRIATNKKEESCRLLAYHTLKTKRALFDDKIVTKRISKFKENLSTEDIAKLLILVLTEDKTDTFIKYFKIDKERRDLDKISKVKKDSGNNITFGGKSVYGSLIGTVCEKYHWTLDYVVWGISYTNLKMLMADAVTSVYLTDEEKRKARVSSDRTFINADDPKNMKMIMEMFKG